MSDQSKLGLGKIITTPQERDAIHVAVAPITAGMDLSPGEHVNAKGIACIMSENIGVVDPFLKSPVKKGERFWLFLYPGTITSLRHEWIHPSFAQNGHAVDSTSEKWLRDFADSVGADYEWMMAVAATHCIKEEEGKYHYPDYLIEGGRWEGQGTPDEFWTHYFNVTGKKPPESEYGNPGIFSCSC